VRLTAALYLCRIEQHTHEVLDSFAEVIDTVPQGCATKGRAWANVFLLVSEAKGITGLLDGMTLNKNTQQNLLLFQSRLD